MATIYWRGDYTPVAQVTLLTVTNPGTSSATLTVTINGKSVGVAVINTQTAIATAALLYAALSASTGVPAEFQEMTWSYTTGDAFVTGTANAPGVPITITGSTAGGQTVTPSNTTAATGPNSLAQAANYVGGVKPVAGDTLVIDKGAAILHDLTEFASVALAGIEVRASFTEAIGLPQYNQNGNYLEYRQRYFQVDGNCAITIGAGRGAGSGCIRFDVTGGTGTITVYGTGQRTETAIPSVNIINCASTTILYAESSADVGVAVEAGQTATVGTLSLPAPTAGTGPTLTLGEGATITTVDQDGGTVVNWGALTTLGMTGGRWEQWGALPTTITCNAGPNGATVVLGGTGTVTTATFRSQRGYLPAVCDCGPDPRARTFTNHTFTGGSVLNDPNKTVTMTNPGTWDQASLAESVLGSGQFTISRA
jgi:hypothetical protein